MTKTMKLSNGKKIEVEIDMGFYNNIRSAARSGPRTWLTDLVERQDQEKAQAAA